MELTYKTNFASARRTWDDFWAGRCDKRPLLKAQIRKHDAPAPHPQPAIYRAPLNGPDEAVRVIDEWANGFHFLGAAVPGVTISFAPDHFALLLGSEMTYTGVTDTGAPAGWVHPFLESYDRPIRFRPERRWWQITVETIAACRKQLDGKVVLSWPHLQGGLDALSAIRGNEQLLMDLVLDPDGVHHALRQISDAVEETRRALAELFDFPATGTHTRHDMYCTGLMDVPQCDFSCMISPEMFIEFGLPALQRECQSLDAAEYHLDGPDAIKHLPAVCRIDRIKTIQWQPGAGAPAERDWSELHRQINSLGRGQFKHGTRQQLREHWRKFPSPFNVYTVRDVTTDDQLQAFADELEREAST